MIRDLLTIIFGFITAGLCLVAGLIQFQRGNDAYAVFFCVVAMGIGVMMIRVALRRMWDFK